MKTIEHQRAANALQRVNNLADRASGFRRRYRSYVERLGPSIVMNGLGQALATERAAAGELPQTEDAQAHYELYLSLQLWLCREPDGIYPTAANLMTAIVENGEPLYLRAQAEALAWLVWHKKFCRATFPRGEEE